MAATLERDVPRAVHPFHAVLLAGTVPLFLAALLSDIAYSRSYQVQWLNFSSWLIAGGLLLGGFVLVFALVDLARTRWRGGSALVHAGLVLVAWVLGFINALVHARDAWATMPTGLVLSAIVAVLFVVATWLAFSGLRVGGAR